MVQRLDKILSSQGATTRSEAHKLIRSGKVSVNGEVCREPSLKIEPEHCEIVLNGRTLSFRQFIYIMMNKPSGVVSASRDSKTKTVIDLLPEDYKRPGLFPAGRLDKDTVGLIIITNDGDFAHRMLSPKKNIIKRYMAVLDGPVGEGEINAFKNGTSLKDGTLCRPAELKVIEFGDNPRVEIGISEGRYHQVKRMFESVGRRVLRLKRVSIGGLNLDPLLKEGCFREISDDEKNSVLES
ncbi:MAG: pseudouridine synthase [Desulfitobacteriaceae bacterium]|nr:pseudouridine synthase [Desulfitobacteriaceae bacterium]